MTDLIARNQAAQREMLATVDRFVVLTRWALEAVAANGAPPGKLALNRLGVSQTGFNAKPSPDRQPTRLPITRDADSGRDPRATGHRRRARLSA